MQFSECVKNISYTANGAISFNSTNNNQLDFFFQVLRDTDSNKINNLADLSWNENKLITLKIIAYIRDCRGGKGERECGRQLLKWLSIKSPANFKINLIHYLQEYGRFDDIIYLLNTNYVSFICSLFKHQLIQDLYNMNQKKKISLLAKWIPSENKSVDKKYKFYKKLANYMNISKQDLRKNYISPLRNYLNIVESQMCSQDWESIDFNKIPSIAMFRYGKEDHVFEKRLSEKFNLWKSKLKTGESKVNASILFPHQIVKQYDRYSQVDPLLEAQWQELIKKGRTYDNIDKTIVLSDVSGSMTGLPMNISITLGLFISELANDNYKNLVVTFESEPQIYNIKGETLCDRIKFLRNAPWGGSTDLTKAILLILNLGLQNNITDDNMPKRLIVVSDMQFNQADKSNFLTNYQYITQLFKKYNYNVPHIVFWNVLGSINDVPVVHDQSNVSLVSGFSIDILKSVLNNKSVTPYETLLAAVNDSRYDKITLVSD